MIYNLKISKEDIDKLLKTGSIQLETIYIEDSEYAEIEIKPILNMEL